MRKTQTVFGLSKLSSHLARPMSDVPNQENFRLLAIFRPGLALPLVVKKDANGCHYLADQFNAHRLPSAFIGWVSDNN